MTTVISTPSDREVVLRRTFAAPRAVVFRALTEPELLKRWYGPSGWRLVVCEIDLRVGGEFRFVCERPNGTRVGQRGAYRELSRPACIVHTEWWEDWNPGECLVTLELTEQAGVTQLTATTVFPSIEVRDTILESGMRRNAEELYARLDDLLTSPATRSAHY